MKNKKRLGGMSWELYLTKINPQTNKYFTEHEAKIHVKSFRKNSIYYWLKNGVKTEEEAKLKVIEYQRKQNKKSVKAVKGRTDVNTTQLKYWMKRGLSEEDAKKRVSERQKTFSLDICIKKYGEKEGKERFKKRQEKWQKSLYTNNKPDEINKLRGRSLENFIEKYGENDGLSLYCSLRIDKGSKRHLIEKTKKLIQNNKDYGSFNKIYNSLLYSYNKRRGQASMESLKYFIPLYKKLRKELKINRNLIRLGVTGSKEICLMGNNKKFFYDFCCLSKKIIVEYNNICWHPNPYILTEEEWKSWKHPFKNQKAEEKYLYDVKKQRLAEENGFKVITIWSHKNFEEQMEYIINEFKNKS